MMRTVCCLAITLAIVCLAWIEPASARVPFYNVFKKEYIDTHPDRKFAETITEVRVRCFLCHQGRNRKNRNPFGDHLSKLLTIEDQKNEEKISESLKMVLAMPSKADDPQSETFAKRFADGKYPGGELEELQKDPPGEPAADASAATAAE